MKISTLTRRALLLAAIATFSTGAQSSASEIAMIKNIGGFYEKTGENIANYYLILSDNATAQWDHNAGLISMTGAGYALTLDLYAAPCETKPILVPAGVFSKGDGTEPMTYVADDISCIYTFNQDGNAESYASLTAPITVEKDEDDFYTFSTEVTINGQTVAVSYKGNIAFDNTSETPSIWPQLKKNIDVKMNYAMGVYDGNLYDSNTGAMYLYLCTSKMDENTAMESSGTKFAIQLFNKLFYDKNTAEVVPGHYTMARNFKRETFYPGTEIDYMGMTIPFGFYVQEYCPGMFADSNYGYSYVTDGTVDIERDSDGKYTIVVDGISSYGHTIKCTFEGTDIPVKDMSDDDKKSSLSTLEDDVVTDLSQIKVARLYYNGVKGANENCHSLILDIGSPSGKDQSIVDNGGQIMRFEFLQKLGQPYLLEGTYTMTEEKWNTFYAPYRMVHGHFNETDLTGTRYMDFIPGRYLVMDNYAPIVEGSAGVMKNADGTYTIKFNFMDDASFHIDGEWTGPVEYLYSPEDVLAGINDVSADASGISITRKDANSILINGADTNTTVTVHTISGVAVHAPFDGETVDISGLYGGIYMLNINGHSFKIAK